jgi:hypothetical protein
MAAFVYCERRPLHVDFNSSHQLGVPMKNFTCALFILSLACGSSLGATKHAKDVPEAPVPASIVHAKKIFLTNGGGSPLAYDEFYAQMNQWKRFEIVGSPAEADIIVELKYFVENLGNRVWSSTNSYTGQTQVYSRRDLDPQLSINIYSGGTKDLLWSVTDHRRLARLEKNREKETINSADRLVADLRSRMDAANGIQ